MWGKYIRRMCLRLGGVYLLVGEPKKPHMGQLTNNGRSINTVFNHVLQTLSQFAVSDERRRSMGE